jgi:ribosomal protein L18E
LSRDFFARLLAFVIDDVSLCKSGVFMSTVKIPKKVADRLAAGLKRYQPIVSKLRERDISEADTVTVIKDMLTDIFGYDKTQS